MKFSAAFITALATSVSAISTETSVVQELKTALVTVTSCSNNDCTHVVQSTGFYIQTVTSESIVTHTTVYCPLTDSTATPAPAPPASTPAPAPPATTPIPVPAPAANSTAYLNTTAPVAPVAPTTPLPQTVPVTSPATPEAVSATSHSSLLAIASTSPVVPAAVSTPYSVVTHPANSTSNTAFLNMAGHLKAAGSLIGFAGVMLLL